MNININTDALRDQKLKKKLLMTVLCVIYPTYILHSCVVSPIYTATSSNIAYNLIPLVFYFVGIIIDIFVIFLSLSLIIYGLLRLDLKRMISIIVAVFLSPFFKYALKLVVSPFVDGVVDANQIFLDIYSMLISGILEVLQYSLILFVAYMSIKKFKTKVFAIKKASERIVKEKLPDISPIPFKHLIDLKNPLQFGAFISGFTIAAIRVLMRLISDIWTLSGITFDLLFFLPYILALLIGIFGYLFMLYMFMNLSLRDSYNEAK